MFRLVNSGERKIAVAFFGQPRFVDSKIALHSHLRAVNNFDVKYFGHMWFDSESTNVVETSPWSGLGKIQLPRNSPQIVRETLPGIQLEVEAPRSFEHLVEECNVLIGEGIGQVDSVRFRNLANTASQLFSIHRVLELVKASHVESGFDLLMLTRFDNLIWRLPNLNLIRSNGLTLSDIHPRFPDAIVIGPPDRVFGTDAFPKFSYYFSSSQCLVAEDFKMAAYCETFPDSSINVEKIRVSFVRRRGLLFNFVVAPSKRLLLSVRPRYRFRRLSRMLFCRAENTQS